MQRSKSYGLATVVLMGALVLLGCEGATEGVFGPLTPEALAAAATQLSPSEVIAGLELEEGQVEEVHGHLESMHAAMLALHDMIPEDVDRLSLEERDELHQALQEQMKDVHRRHQTLMGALTEEQQGRFVEHIHGHLEGTGHFAGDDHGGTLHGEKHAGLGHGHL